MAIRQQVLHSINFTQLKSLSNVNVDFEPHNVTGVFGANGSGKSTIIHALLGVYKPSDQDLNRKNFRFSQFFTPTTHANWIGSSFNIIHSYRQEASLISRQLRSYGKQRSRWKPRYENRPERNVYFIGLSTSVPDIELEKKQSLIRLSTSQLNDQISTQIRQKAGYILNRDYQEYNTHTHHSKTYLGVRHQNIHYSSLAMGAGEQRIFRILDVLFKAANYSLIIIDEIDSTLHTDALNRLLEVVVEVCNNKNLQVIFTSHREELIKRKDINIRHIYQMGSNTLCFNNTNPDCLVRLTGTRVRPIEIFVEDNVASEIVLKVTEELGIARHCSIKKYGAATNSFSLATGMLIKGENLENIGIFIDGDIYRTQQEKEDQIKRYFSGTDSSAIQNRQNVLSVINQFNLPPDTKPEEYIHQALTKLNDGSEVCDGAMAIQAVLDSHQYVANIILNIGYADYSVGLSKVIDKFSTTPEWIPYSQPLRDWLMGKAQGLHLIN